MSNEPVPQRLSDAERDEAVAMLREHYEAGRLDESEFTERLEQALASRFATDLTGLFSDLPEPHPGVVTGRPSPAMAWTAPSYDLEPSSDAGVPAAASGTGGTDWIGVARGVIWPVAIVLAFVTGNWGLFIIGAIIGSIVLGQVASNQRKPPPYLDRRPPPSIGR